MQPPVQAGGILRIGQCPRGQAVGGDHDVAQSIPQLLGGKPQNFQLGVLGVLQQEDVHILHADNGGPHLGGRQLQRQVQAAAGKGSVFLLPGEQQLPDIGSGGEQQTFGGTVDMDHGVILHAEGRAEHQLHQGNAIAMLFHDSPPLSLACAEWGKSFPVCFNIILHFTLY